MKKGKRVKSQTNDRVAIADFDYKPITDLANELLKLTEKYKGQDAVFDLRGDEMFVVVMREETDEEYEARLASEEAYNRYAK